MAGGFVSGAGEGMSDYAAQQNKDTTAQQDSALALKMHSTLLQQEHEQRLSEASAKEGEEKDIKTFEQGLKSVPPDQFAKISKYLNDSSQALRDRKPFPELDASTITHPAAQQMLERGQGMLAHASASMIPVSFHPINANGHTVMSIYDKGGNLLDTQDKGLNAEGAAAVQKAETEYGKYTAGLINAKSKLNSFMTANTAGMLPEQVAKVTIDKYIQDNPDVKTYFDQLPLMALKGEIDLTHSARAVQALGKSAQDAYPQRSDTIPVALDKLNSLTDVGRDGMDATYHSYGVDPKQQHYPNYNLQESLKKQSDASKFGAKSKENSSRLDRIKAALAAQAQSQSK